MKLHLCRLRMHDGAPVDAAAVDTALLHLLRCGLPQDECERLRAIRNVSARAQSVGARLALVWALSSDADAVGLHDFDDCPPVPQDGAPPLSVLCRSEAGAPYLAGRDCCISFAHSASLAVCALTKDGRVGVDVEPLDRRLPHAEDIVSRYFSEGERATLDAATDRDMVFLRIWTRKEALGKVLGTGLKADAEVLDTEAYPPDCFWERVLEDQMVSGCILK